MKIQLPRLLAVVLGALMLNPVAAQLASSGSYSLVGSMSQFRRAQIATLLANGKVLVAGGFNSADNGLSTELFDPASVVPVPTLLTQPTRLQTGAFQFAFRNTPGLSFTVLSTTDLVAPASDWMDLGMASAVSPGHNQFTDANASIPPDVSMEFNSYRVRHSPD